MIAAASGTGTAFPTARVPAREPRAGSVPAAAAAAEAEEYPPDWPEYGGDEGGGLRGRRSPIFWEGSR